MQAWEQHLDDQKACTCIHLPTGYIRDPACQAPNHHPPKPRLG